MVSGDPLDSPIDRGDRLSWSDGGIVTVRDFYVAEDGETQVRVEESDTTRTVTVDDLVEAVADGRLHQ